MYIHLHTVLPSIKFNGLCRYKNSTGGDKFNEIKSNITARSVEDCEKKCKRYHSQKKKNDFCVAFAFETRADKNCHLYKGGPYTHGLDVANTNCYILPQGILSCTLNILYRCV